MIEVFKTNVGEEQVATIVAALSQQLPSLIASFDLEDCDRILRVEGQEILSAKIIEVLNTHGCHCSVLDH